MFVYLILEKLVIIGCTRRGAAFQAYGVLLVNEDIRPCAQHGDVRGADGETRNTPHRHIHLHPGSR